MSARSKRLLEMALGVETDCSRAKIFKDKDGGLWYPTSNFEETNLHVCSGKQSDVLLTTNFHSRSLVENMSEVQKEKPSTFMTSQMLPPDIQRQNQIICQVDRNKENIIPLSIDFDNFNAGQSVKYTEKGTNSYTIICSESTNDNAYFNIDSAEKPSDVAIKLRRQEEITNTSPKKKSAISLRLQKAKLIIRMTKTLTLIVSQNLIQIVTKASSPSYLNP
nr:unnamed protein product [Callosobruchus analis]